MNHVTDQTKMINRTLKGVTAQRPNKVIPNQLEKCLDTTIVTSVGDVMLNQVVPTMEVCLNMVAGELEKANRACTGVKSLTDSVMSLQSELSELRTVLKGKLNPRGERSLWASVTEESIEHVIVREESDS